METRDISQTTSSKEDIVPKNSVPPTKVSDLQNSLSIKSVKVDCSFCGKEIECPEDMLENSNKHMCYECFITREPSDEEIKDVHVDIPMDKMTEIIASGIADKVVEEIFPNFWSERKQELKEMSKGDLAMETFGMGAYIGVKTFIETMDKAEESKSTDNKKE